MQNAFWSGDSKNKIVNSILSSVHLNQNERLRILSAFGIFIQIAIYLLGRWQPTVFQWGGSSKEVNWHFYSVHVPNLFFCVRPSELFSSVCYDRHDNWKRELEILKHGLPKSKYALINHSRAAFVTCNFTCLFENAMQTKQPTVLQKRSLLLELDLQGWQLENSWKQQVMKLSFWKPVTGLEAGFKLSGDIKGIQYLGV